MSKSKRNKKGRRSAQDAPTFLLFSGDIAKLLHALSSHFGIFDIFNDVKEGIADLENVVCSTVL